MAKASLSVWKTKSAPMMKLTRTMKKRRPNRTMVMAALCRGYKVHVVKKATQDHTGEWVTEVTMDSMVSRVLLDQQGRP